MGTITDPRKAQMRRALNWSAWLFTGYLFTTYIVLTDGLTTFTTRDSTELHTSLFAALMI